MKEKEGFISNPLEWKPDLPKADITIDPVRFAHLLVYDRYCQVVIKHITSPALSKSNCFTILKELKSLREGPTIPKSKVLGVKYTLTSIKIGNCVFLGSESYLGLVKALETYCKDDPYPKDDYSFTDTEISEVIYKHKLGIGILYAWWYLGKVKKQPHIQLKLIGPNESFSYGFSDIQFVDKLAEAVKTLAHTDAREVKITTDDPYLNMRVFKQILNNEPAICISTDSLGINQRTLFLYSYGSVSEFIAFLKKAKSKLKK